MTVSEQVYCVPSPRKIREGTVFGYFTILVLDQEHFYRIMSVVTRSIFVCSSLSCFIGLLLFFAHTTFGQGTRYLFDPAVGTPQPRATPPPTATHVFVPVPSVPSINGTTTAGFPESAPLANIPNTPISNELGRVLTRDMPALADVEEPPSAVAPNAHMARQAIDRLTTVLESVFESETEDEREDRELWAQRQRAEQLVDPELREAALERVVQAEVARQNRLARRAIDEVGADLFDVPRLQPQYLHAGWCQLFDGHTDTGWRVQDSGHYGGGRFTFGQGEIRSDPYHPGMVHTTMPFGDLTLRFDYWAEKNSEVFLLLKTPPNPEDLNTSCYTIVLNSGRSDRPRGLLLGRHDYSLPQLRTMREMWDNPTSEEEGSWHSVQVRIEAGTIQIWLDRRSVSAYFDPKPISVGHIAFLVAKGEARFRNIIWQPKQTIAVFDAEGRSDLPWHISENMEIIGNNTAGFRLLGGSVESTDIFGNFVLQMQYFQGSISGNSSLFVRALPGQKNTGYEISLQNFPSRQDRESTVGVDAGSFRHIRDARYVRAQDMQWTHLTVAVMDRQLKTWVNGVPVSEIEGRHTSVSETGPFLEPGTIRLTVPEDNTSFQFRRLTVSPVAP